MAADGAETARLEELRTILETAHELAVKLAADPLMERVLRVFTKLPEPDREPILQVIERDATWCRIVEETSPETGITVRPNPHASLYVQVVEHGQPPSEPMRRDIDVIRLGIEHFVRLLPLFFQEGVHEQWTASARELIRNGERELIEHAGRLAHEVLALIAEGNGGGGPSPAT